MPVHWSRGAGGRYTRLPVERESKPAVPVSNGRPMSGLDPAPFKDHKVNPKADVLVANSGLVPAVAERDEALYATRWHSATSHSIDMDASKSTSADLVDARAVPARDNYREPSTAATELGPDVETRLPVTVQHMLAGGTAGIAEHVGLYPVDLVKTRMQSYHGQAGFARHSVRSAIQVICREEGGLRALWRGVGAVALSAGPAHAIYFATYEALRARLVPLVAVRAAVSEQELGRAAHQRGGLSEPVAVASAGAFATVLSDGVMAPFDVIKQRMQVERRYHSVWDTMLRVYREQGGMKALYAGYGTALVMNIPFSAAYFTVYEACRECLSLMVRVEDPQKHAHSRAFVQHGVHFVSGAFAGAAAAGITNPLDVVRTRLQTQGEPGARRYRNMWTAFRAVALEEGARGLWAGLVPRMLFHAPAGAIAWTTFELVKRICGLDRTLEAPID